MWWNTCKTILAVVPCVSTIVLCSFQVHFSFILLSVIVYCFGIDRFCLVALFK